MKMQNNLGRRVRATRGGAFFTAGDVGRIVLPPEHYRVAGEVADEDGDYWVLFDPGFSDLHKLGRGPWCVGREGDGLEFLDDAAHAEAAADIGEDID